MNARTFLFGLALLGAAAFPSRIVWAADDDAESDIEMRPIDRSTVRIFGIEGVTETQAEGKKTQTKRLVAVVEAGHGSGVVIDASGIILTAKHVVEHAEILAVKAPGDDRVYAARTIYMDPDHDIAFVAIDGRPPRFQRLPERVKGLRAGQHVTASGYPLDANQSTPALSSGHISRRTEDGMYQLDLSVNPGNSGGPVTDDQGNILGIVVQGADPKQGAQGFALAEPLQRILEAYTSVTSAARSQSFTESEHAVAEAAYELVRSGPFGIVTDRDVHDKLVALGPTKRPAVLALMAAHTWNMLMGFLEERRVAKVDDLSDGDDRKTATELLADCIRLCRAAVAVDPTLVDRSGFVKDVLAAADVWAHPKEGAASVQGSDTQPDHATESEPFRRPRVGVDFLALGTGDSFAGGLAVVGDVFRFAHHHVALTVGGEGTVGQWRNNLAGGAAVDLGARASVGKVVGVVGGLFYTPGFVAAEGRSAFGARSYRAEAGVYFGGFTLGATIQEINRGADTVLRTVGGYAEVGF